ncbi:MAG: YitT family protein [Bacteroidales bacterium]|nr:YitT family protein [Bacteroidales bacterium]
MEKVKQKPLTVIKDYLIISIGVLLYALAWTVFAIPHKLVGGGVTGISAIVQYATGFNMSYTMFIINAVLLLIALRVLGVAFGARTVYAIVFSSLAFRFLPGLIPEEFIQEFSIENGKMLSAIFGGALSGLGCALAITHGGSTGGTDIIALIINKFYNISTGTIFIILDVVIIASSLLVPSDAGWGSRFANVIYGYIACGVFSYCLDLFMTGQKQSVQMMVFSENYQRIADRITREENRGVSVLDVQGWHTKQDRKMLLVVVRKNEMNQVLSLIKAEDKQAFVSVGSVQGVFGEGFEKIKR